VGRGEGGYQVGNFPPQLVRMERALPRHRAQILAGPEQTLAEFATAHRQLGPLRLARRKSHASINFVTCHDGFTLTDLVSYDDKHNEANGEDNRDGEPTTARELRRGRPDPRPAIAAVRKRQKRNFLATLLFSQGVPMLLAGDEFRPHAAGQQQRVLPRQPPPRGSTGSTRRHDLLEFTKNLIELRRKHPILRRRRWFEGTSIRGTTSRTSAGSSPAASR
jgi:isoamylase